MSPLHPFHSVFIYSTIISPQVNVFGNALNEVTQSQVNNLLFCCKSQQQKIIKDYILKIESIPGAADLHLQNKQVEIKEKKERFKLIL